MQTQVQWSDPVWIAEVSDGLEWTEIARGTAPNETSALQQGQAALNAHLGIIDGVDEIAAAQAWGSAIVRAFEAAAMEGGINAHPAAALALDRYLREVSSSLAQGRLHVAYAAMQELLSQPESSRPVGAGDESLMPIFMALAQRLELPAEIVEQSLIDINMSLREAK